MKQRYLSVYSLTWLRERDVRLSSFNTHSDLWHALFITFDAQVQRQSAFGLLALGGLLALFCFFNAEAMVLSSPERAVLASSGIPFSNTAEMAESGAVKPQLSAATPSTGAHPAGHHRAMARTILPNTAKPAS